MANGQTDELDDEHLIRELHLVHEARVSTLRHGSADALDASTARIDELENEYLHRHPNREVDPERTREGARARVAGADAR